MSTPFDTSEVDVKIASLRKQYDDLEARQDRRIDWDMQYAQSIIQKELQSLAKLRTSILAGEDVDPPPAAHPNCAPKLRRWKRLTKAGERTSIELECSPIEGERRTILDRLLRKYVNADPIELIEDFLQEIVDGAREKNWDQPIAFSRGLYVGLLHYLADQWVRAEARIEFNAIQRDQLEKRICALESRPALRYAGVWCEGGHKTGEFVSYGGSMWHCKTDTSDIPGTSENWQLCVKRGRDARERKDAK